MRYWCILMLFLGAFLGSMTPAHASERHRFVVGNLTPQALADKVDASLARDPLGHSVIDPVSCSRNRACATPEDYIDMIAKSDPVANLTDVKELSGFLRKLKAVAAPSTGQYWMACMKGKGDINDEPVWDCMTRSFHPGETVFIDPVTGAMVMARDCSNPVGKEQHEQDCIPINVALKEGDEVHIGWLGPDAFPEGRCKLSVQKTGEQERSGYVMDECPRDQCDFSGPSRDLGGLRVWAQPRISWRARVTGNNIIRVPREVLKARGVFVFCVIKPNGVQSRGKVIGSGTILKGSAYVDDMTVITYQSMRGQIAWRGTPYTWVFMDGTVE